MESELHGGRAVDPRRISREVPPSPARARPARHGAGLAGRGAARGAVPLRGRDPRLPLARRPRAPPHRLPRGGGRAPAADRGGDAHVGHQAGPRGAGRRRRGRRAPHGAPLHRRRDAEGRAQDDPPPLGQRRGRVARPARRGHRDPGGGRPLRRALPRRARDAGRRGARLAGAPGAGGRLDRPASAREPVREGLRAHAAAAPRGARGRPRGRGPPHAPAARAREGARRPPAHRHGVGGHDRGHARPGVRAARRSRAARRAVVRDRDAGLSARVAGAARAGARVGERLPSASSRWWCGW